LIARFHTEVEIVLLAFVVMQAESEHPLGRAIVQYMNGESFSNEQMSEADGSVMKNWGWKKKVSSFKAIAGRGVSSVVEGRNILVLLLESSLCLVTFNEYLSFLRYKHSPSL
jgi:cation transport ATPase